MAMSTAAQAPALPHLMLNALAKNWWLLLIRGLCGILFGVAAIAWPGLTLLFLAIFFGAFALVDGILSLTAAIRGGTLTPRWWLALLGIAGIAAGLLAFLWPGMTALVLLYFIAAWAIVIGATQIVGAIALRKEISDEWLLIAGGTLSILFGLALFVRPGAGAVALAIVIGAFAIAHGFLFVLFALRVRAFQKATS
jgi:uncharacterized membrane protein HdeD (DUF308 family)